MVVCFGAALILLPISNRVAAEGFSWVTQFAEINVPHFDATYGDFQPYMAGGAAAGDFDGDGWTDLYVTRIDRQDSLYRNLGNGKFRDVTEGSFGPNHLAEVQSNGAAWGDVDNDGDLDLYVTSLRSNVYHLYINDGIGNFSDQAGIRGADLASDDLHFGFSASFGDYDHDGYLDLYLTEWRSKLQNPTLARQNSKLMRNLGEAGPGHYEDVTDKAGVSMEGVIPSNRFFDSQTFTGRFADLDGDGWTDLAVTSDHGTSRLFWNDGQGAFIDGTVAANVGTDTFGMGSAIGDIDADGDLDWFVSSIYKPNSVARSGNRLYRNLGGREFDDATDTFGVRDGGWGWGAAMWDFDNDGDLDVVQASGQHFPFAASVSQGFETGQVFLWRNDGSGEFLEVSQEMGLRDAGNGKGLLTWDYDEDGDLDLLVLKNGDVPSLWKNNLQNDHHWLKIDLQGITANRQGIGARIWIDPDENTVGDEILREVSGSTHYLGQSPSTVHVGLREFDSVDRISVLWPDGMEQIARNVPADRTVRIVQYVGEPTAGGAAWCLLAALVWRRWSRPPIAERRNHVRGSHLAMQSLDNI